MRTLTLMLQKGKIDKKTGLLTNIREDKSLKGLRIRTKDEFDPMTMRWSMLRTWKEKGKVKSYKTNVRTFFLPELKNMMEQNGLRIKTVWGDFRGASFGLEARRLIVLAGLLNAGFSGRIRA